ncbi:MAG TPA: hypothetical protein VEQ66_06630 [Propionibacteriaceae bacterium]|nr:hypothetical protein [Propionibacteriaceae bacterium]
MRPPLLDPYITLDEDTENSGRPLGYVGLQVHVGTGGGAFHAPARQLSESMGFTGFPVLDYTRAI